MEINYENISLKFILKPSSDSFYTWHNDKELKKYSKGILYVSKKDQYNSYLKQNKDEEHTNLSIYKIKEQLRIIKQLQTSCNNTVV